MKLRLFALFSLAVAGSLLADEVALPTANPPYYRVRYEASTQPGELIFGVSYTIWLPPGVKTLRGIVVHQHGCGDGACRAGQTAAFDLHWQALAKQHECALLGPSYEQPEKANCGMWCDPRNGSDQAFLKALEELAVKTGHPELTTVPWALWGHSGGAAWVGTMLALHPEKVVGVWLRSGLPRLVSREDASKPPLELSPAVLAVPVMCNLGTKEGVTVKEGRFAGLWKMMQPFFEDFRGKGGLIGVAIDPLTSHDCGNQRYLAIPWLDTCLTARLPEKPGDPLRPMPTDGAWLAPLNDGAYGEAPQPAAKFTGDKAKSVWLPDEALAARWAQYVKDTAVADTTPPPAPKNVRVNAAGELTWDAEADLESGLASFIIERDGQPLAQLSDKPTTPFGRPIFQKNNYSDTPTQPLAAMQFTDSSAKPGEKHEYRVISVNSAGLRSSAAVASDL